MQTIVVITIQIYMISCNRTNNCKDKHKHNCNNNNIYYNNTNNDHYQFFGNMNTSESNSINGCTRIAAAMTSNAPNIQSNLAANTIWIHISNDNNVNIGGRNLIYANNNSNIICFINTHEYRYVICLRTYIKCTTTSCCNTFTTIKCWIQCSLVFV